MFGYDAIAFALLGALVGGSLCGFVLHSLFLLAMGAGDHLGLLELGIAAVAGAALASLYLRYMLRTTRSQIGGRINMASISLALLGLGLIAGGVFSWSMVADMERTARSSAASTCSTLARFVDLEDPASEACIAAAMECNALVREGPCNSGGMPPEQRQACVEELAEARAALGFEGRELDVLNYWNQARVLCTYQRLVPDQ